MGVPGNAFCNGPKVVHISAVIDLNSMGIVMLVVDIVIHDREHFRALNRGDGNIVYFLMDGIWTPLWKAFAEFCDIEYDQVMKVLKIVRLRDAKRE